MKMDKTESICGFAEDVLAYVYNELPAVARDRFESHLADCPYCIDELAELSYSFYSVHEWRQLDFDPLPTPAFSVPMNETSPSLAARIKAVLFPAPARLAFAGAFGALVIAGVIGFNLIAPSDQEVAGIVQNVKVPATIESVPDPALPRRTATEDSEQTPSKVADTTTANERPARIERARVTKPSTRSVGKKDAVALPRPTVAEAATSSPRLSDFEDSPDDSLRLSDLLAEADARD